MNNKDSPFKACNSIIDPTELIANCKYDACRCQDPMACVCSSFAAYSKQCAEYGKVVNWRFRGTFLYPPLTVCGKFMLQGIRRVYTRATKKQAAMGIL